jgi:carbohydrate diacid regulator
VFDNDFVLIMKDADLIQSVDSLFENNLILSETSKKTFLHRNTLLYRINKIQSATGYDLRNFSDAMSFKLLMLIYYRFN